MGAQLVANTAVLYLFCLYLIFNEMLVHSVLLHMLYRMFSIPFSVSSVVVFPKTTRMHYSAVFCV